MTGAFYAGGFATVVDRGQLVGPGRVMRSVS